MMASTRLNAFLWNRVSQGYGRLVQDAPPFARWQAWRRGGTSRDLTASLYCTPPPSAPFPAPGPSGSLPEEPDNAAEQEQQDQKQEDEETAAAVTCNSVAAAQDMAATAQNTTCSATIYRDDNIDVLAATFDGSLEGAPPFPMSDLLRGASLATASTGGTGDLSRRRISFTLEVPQDMVLTDLLCTVSPAEVSSNNRSKLKTVSLIVFGTNSTCRDDS